MDGEITLQSLANSIKHIEETLKQIAEQRAIDKKEREDERANDKKEREDEKAKEKKDREDEKAKEKKDREDEKAKEKRDREDEKAKDKKDREDEKARQWQYLDDGDYIKFLSRFIWTNKGACYAYRSNIIHVKSE